MSKRVRKWIIWGMIKDDGLGEGSYLNIKLIKEGIKNLGEVDMKIKIKNLKIRRIK